MFLHEVFWKDDIEGTSADLNCSFVIFQMIYEESGSKNHGTNRPPFFRFRLFR